MSDAEGIAEPPSAANPEAARTVEQRLCRIIEAVGGTDVKTNGQELWFVPEATSGVEVRLGADREGRCYDRSANFAISYGGTSDDSPPPDFGAVVERIKAVDEVAIPGATEAFESAAGMAARRFSGAADAEAGGGEAQCPDEWWERRLVRQLNVVFLDLCAALIGGRRGPLSPLHWGFWPARDPAPVRDDYDPFEAFSENLVGCIPRHVTRIMDVGCGRGAITRVLATRDKLVTAVSPVAHHCAVIEEAGLPGVEVRCARFDDLPPEPRYDLLLFSESVNHFALDDGFFARCSGFLAGEGFVLLADDLTEDRIAAIEAQRMFRMVRTWDISENVAPTAEWWARQQSSLAAYRAALLSILELYDASVADRARAILDTLDSPDLKLLFSGKTAPPVSKGRYMIYLLQLAA